jgi:hypothetical protein
MYLDTQWLLLLSGNMWTSMQHRLPTQKCSTLLRSAIDWHHEQNRDHTWCSAQSRRQLLPSISQGGDQTLKNTESISSSRVYFMTPFFK